MYDNWEWGTYDPRFGLYQVECRSGDLTRVPTETVPLYREIALNNGVTQAMIKKYTKPGDQ